MSSARLESRLQTLGFLLGIDEWARSFQKRFELDKACLKQAERIDDGMGGVIEVFDEFSSYIYPVYGDVFSDILLIEIGVVISCLLRF